MHTVPLTAPLTPNTTPQALVDLDAIANNVRVLREHAGSAEVMAVVKADGYGHGATRAARAALAAGAAELGVATIEEALALRADGVTAPILAWLHAPGTDFACGALCGRADRGVVSAPAGRAARRGASHRCDRDLDGEDRHRAEPQRGERGRVSGDAGRAAARSGGRDGAGARVEIAHRARRRARPSD